MVMVMLVLSFLVLLRPAVDIITEDIQERVDISVYFKTTALQEDIFQIRSELNALPEVREVTYVSSEEALERFIERHRDDEVIMESLTEVGENPFLAHLNVKAREAEHYEQIVHFLEQELSCCSIQPRKLIILSFY